MRATAHGPEAVAAADAAPDDIDAAFAAADVQILSQDVDGAFGRLVGLVRRTAGDERTAVRTRLIELFELFDPADPEVVAGRRNLASALLSRKDPEFTEATRATAVEAVLATTSTSLPSTRWPSIPNGSPRR